MRIANRWEQPFRGATNLQEQINRVFGDVVGRTGEESNLTPWAPPVDIYETDAHEVVLKAELPEMKREDISVTFENGVLTLKGERKFEQETKKENYHRVERRHGTFSRSFTLPNTVDPSRISAAYKDGILTIRLPQREEAKPKQIDVNIG